MSAPASSDHSSPRAYREEVAREAMAPEDKLLQGPRLFARTCRLLADGVRHRHLELDEKAVLEAVKALLRRRDALERAVP